MDYASAQWKFEIIEVYSSGVKKFLNVGVKVTTPLKTIEKK